MGFSVGPGRAVTGDAVEPVVNGPAPPGPESPGPESAVAGTVGRLTMVNAVVMALGVGSGILQARGLGPSGRGQLAAIVVPLFFVGFLGDFGLGLFARREAARARSVGEVIGTVGVLVAAIGVVLAAALLPAVEVVARGRPLVHHWLTVGLLFLPLNLVGSLLLNVAFGLERWNVWARAKLVASAGWTAVLAVLYATGRLTVGAAALSFIVVTLASYLPVLAVLRRAMPLRVRRSVVREAVPFGSRAWLASLTNLANTRLDQVVMAGVVSSRQLGLYAVAVTLASFPSNFSSAVGLWILPRVARHGADRVPVAIRLSLAAVTAIAVLIALVAWPVVHFVVGHRFSDALPMIWLLLAAEVPLAGTVTLGQAFIGAGRPAWVAAAEGFAVVVTITGLAVVLKPLGGVGAAMVSIVAYSVSFGYLLVRARGMFGASLRELVVPTGDDLRWGAVEIRRLLSRRGSNRGP